MTTKDLELTRNIKWRISSITLSQRVWLPREIMTKKALPRPKVDVKAEGANVIVIKMTFPDNENIQGLRAFTPTDPRELDQFADLDDLVPVGSSISKVTAQVPREKFFFDAQSGQIRDGHI